MFLIADKVYGNGSGGVGKKKRCGTGRGSEKGKSSKNWTSEKESKSIG